MGLETGTFISDLIATNPTATDGVSQGDDHLRLLKSVLRTTFPNAGKAFEFPVSLTKTSDYVILLANQNCFLLGDATGGNVSLTLPTLASGDKGWSITLSRADASANALTIVGTVNGEVNFSLTKQYQSATVFWDGSEWWAFHGLRIIAGVPTLDSLLVLGDASFTSTDSIAIANGTTAQRNVSPSAGDTRYNSTLNVTEFWNGTSWILLGQFPTVQTFLSGSGTYTPSTGVARIRVRMVGGGAGGGATISNAGTDGNTTSFGGWTALGGKGGPAANNFGAIGGLGGTGGDDGTGTLVIRLAGERACGTATTGTNTIVNQAGSSGGGSAFFNGSGAGGPALASGYSGTPNTGGGGGGAGSDWSAANSTASSPGGGGGESVEFYVNGPTATSYSVAATANGGPSGGYAGGSGASGVIIVEEFYS